MTQLPSNGKIEYRSVIATNSPALGSLVSSLTSLASIAEVHGLVLTANLLDGARLKLLRVEMQQQLAGQPAVAKGRLLRITYVSRMANRRGSQCLQLAREIADSSAVRNAALGITGALCFGEGWFAQVIEGPTDAVSALFQRIRTDRRHCDVRVIEREYSGRRLFGQWSMGLADETPAHLIRKAAQTATQSRRAPISGRHTGAGRSLHSVLITALVRSDEALKVQYRRAG